MSSDRYEQARRDVLATYPADSQHINTAKIGQRLLEQARAETVNSWRDESRATVIKYAELCRKEETKMLMLLGTGKP